MRQRTDQKVLHAVSPISELPMRQRTLNEGRGLARDLSELPMRQRTASPAPARRAEVF